MMRYATVCSGIECFSAGVPSSWAPVFFSEIEAFPSAVLKHHYPGIPNHGDMRSYESWPDHAIDLLAGGTPCQSFSVAGLRAGLDDPRGNLMLTYLAIARRYRPRWLVWENVPGVLSSNGGRDFGTLLRGLAECGYHAAWRVLDAQFVRVDSHPRAVPQRRRRVFLVGHSDWRRAAAVLLERSSLSGDPAPRRQAGQNPAPTIAARTSGGGGLGTDFDCDGGLIAGAVTASNGDRGVLEGDAGMLVVAKALTARPHSAHREDADTYIPGIVPQAMSSKWSKGSSGPADDEIANLVAHSLSTQCRCATEDGTGRGAPLIAFSAKDHGADAQEGAAPTLRAMGHAGSHANGGGQAAVAYDLRNGTEGDVAMTLQSGGMGEERGRCINAIPHVVDVLPSVRRLLPLECERLMGLPDGYTQLPGRTSDGPRYKALGNGMAVNCIRWLCQRIDMVEAIP